MSETMQLDNRRIAARAGWVLVRDHGFDEWYPPDYDANTNPGYHAYVPMYLGSTDAALTLPLDAGYRFLLFGAAGDSWHCYIENEVGAIIDGTGAHADCPAAAICAAWWAWKDAQEAR